MRRERQPNNAVTLAADLERRRIEQRATRIDAVVRELRLRARFHRERHGQVPAPLRHAIAGFLLELRALDRRLGELPPDPDAARAQRSAPDAATPARR
jgi:hypothetical protein